MHLSWDLFVPSPGCRIQGECPRLCGFTGGLERKLLIDYYLLSCTEKENADPSRQLGGELTKWTVLFCALVSKLNPHWSRLYHWRGVRRPRARLASGTACSPLSSFFCRHPGRGPQGCGKLSFWSPLCGSLSMASSLSKEMHDRTQVFAHETSQKRCWSDRCWPSGANASHSKHCTSLEMSTLHVSGAPQFYLSLLKRRGDKTLTP